MKGVRVGLWKHGDGTANRKAHTERTSATCQRGKEKRKGQNGQIKRDGTVKQQVIVNGHVEMKRNTERQRDKGLGKENELSIET